MQPAEWIKKELEGEGLHGKVIYDKDNDAYELDIGALNVGLESPLWEDYDGDEIAITIKIIRKNNERSI